MNIHANPNRWAMNPSPRPFVSESRPTRLKVTVKVHIISGYTLTHFRLSPSCWFRYFIDRWKCPQWSSIHGSAVDVLCVCVCLCVRFL